MPDSFSFTTPLPSKFLQHIISEFDDTDVRAIILHGSYARNEAYPPYSDVDIVRIMQETPERKQQKRFIWRDGYLFNLSSRPLSIYRDWLTIPQEAIFRISTIRDAQILLDKDGAFQQFQQEADQWRWEILQPFADTYASQHMVELSETILRTLRALQTHHSLMLIERITHHILPRVLRAVAVQKGIIATGNNHLSQVQETLGFDSPWAHYYMHASGVTNGKEKQGEISLEQRGIAALYLYKETVRLLRHSFSQEHLETIEVIVQMIDAYCREHQVKL